MKLFKYMSLVALGLLLWSCQANEVGTYDGPSQIHFMESKGSMIINDTNPEFTIEVGVSKAVDIDRSFNVKVDIDNSSAIEGQSFELVNNKVTIPAGEVLGSIVVKGLFEGAEPLGQVLKLNLGADNSDEVAKYSNTFTLDLFKFCDFDRDAFVGTLHVTETDFWKNVYEYEVTSVAVDNDPYSIFVTGLWAVDEPVKITFSRNETGCYITSQYFFDDGNYVNAWIKSITDGIYNSCLGSIESIEYFVYPGDTPDSGWDRGTFDMYKITD